MLPLRIPRLAPTPFVDLIASAPYALVRLDRNPAISFHKGVAEFFERAWPNLFRYATLCRADVRNPAWWDGAFRSSVGAIRGGVQDGYFLFEAGLVVGSHNGAIRPAGLTYGGDHEVAAQRARVLQYAFPDAEPNPADLEACRQIAAYFDAIVARKQRPTEAGGYVYEERGSATPPPPPGRPPPPPPAPAAPDPWTILGIARTATEEEVRAAYREQMKLNHPDRVAHLSPALQQFAHAQVLAIQAAYEAVRKSR